jgi:putative two-component system protein, hydrogenase maturation factor HypX/HoxX
MRILLLSSAYNGLCQRAHTELEAVGHDISIALALTPDYIRKQVTFFQPDLIICPFLKEKIPEDIWSKNLCLIVHPGIKGDRGPSSLDWAIMMEEKNWGVTVLQAVEEMDAGAIWATETFVMRQASKASLYRQEVTTAAVKAILEAVKRVEIKSFEPEPLDYSKPDIRGELKPLMKQDVRAINWDTDDVATVIKKINAADSAPGVLTVIHNQEFYLYGGYEESDISGWKGFFEGWKPGNIIAKRQGAICIAAKNGAVWISHLKRKNKAKEPIFKRLLASEKQYDFKLPATKILGNVVEKTPELLIDTLYMGNALTFKEIWYEENHQVGYLHFDFHNGAMSTEQCQRLLEAYRLALLRPTKVLVLMGGKDFWSNGIHLNTIEAADNPADESWRNINAIDDWVLAILTTESKLTVSAVWGNCGAGGAMAILAADKVWARKGVIFNPHYKAMGLYGSEYWTYSLPRRVGPVKALELTQAILPIGTKKAKAIGYIDDILADEYSLYLEQVRHQAEAIAADHLYEQMLQIKREARQRDEQVKPLSAYRTAELQKMKMNFSGKCLAGEINYHQARYNFVHKVKPNEAGACMVRHLPHDIDRLSELRQAIAY